MSPPNRKQPVKPSERQQSRSSKQPVDWKENPLVVAVLAVAGTASFMGGVVLPVLTSYQAGKIEAMSEASKDIDATRAELDKTKKLLANAKSDLAVALKKNPFSSNSVYPIGLDKVTIGMPLEKVYEAYTQVTKDQPDDSYVSAKTENPNFYSVTYYYDEDDKKKLITSILLHNSFDSDLGAEYFKRVYTGYFGTPIEWKGFAYWKATKRESVEVARGGSITIIRSDRIPIYVKNKFNSIHTMALSGTWPRERPTGTA